MTFPVGENVTAHVGSPDGQRWDFWSGHLPVQRPSSRVAASQAIKSVAQARAPIQMLLRQLSAPDHAAAKLLRFDLQDSSPMPSRVFPITGHQDQVSIPESRKSAVFAAVQVQHHPFRRPPWSAPPMASSPPSALHGSRTDPDDRRRLWDHCICPLLAAGNANSS